MGGQEQEAKEAQRWEGGGAEVGGREVHRWRGYGSPVERDASMQGRDVMCGLKWEVIGSPGWEVTGLIWTGKEGPEMGSDGVRNGKEG